jgi:hypothetical protein
VGRYGDRGILFLDEINRATRDVQQAAFELVLDRRLNLRSLPDGWRVIAAINGDDSIYTVNAMEPAFLSRFCLIDLNPTIQEWLSWAEGHIHESIIQFIRKCPEFLDAPPEMIKEASKQGVVKVQDRRAWEMFSKSIKKLEKDFEDEKRPLHPLDKKPEASGPLILMTSSFVGTMAATAYQSFVMTDYQALDANAILNKFNPDIKKKIKEIVEAGRIPELAAYNELLLAYIDKHVKDHFNPRQKENLVYYLELLPKEIVSDFWKKFNNDFKEVSKDWYGYDKNTTKRTYKVIKGALVSPID